ncbi:putative RNA Polymerase II CTD phosphatase Fcp1 [Taphrina deformans PYCC 5710]|uniref:RNA polymerase II subunit A C-terminal domain phosphatase n=1 Tax=Taphrina deformans (strain PYCC 5710 / ATCC 11124 / CBS 356.35 / IMI 108563 / JCM 9778 / NBRC 8474) TaxID=1097556 RepID=R4X7V4_TAPDE|nr:putative RNA Polymerase II CTD phosphatase Fcp1 [Taphrina deformans PYCC 5710]|eukprot:CCG81291.1 putative RNA Polymerase II CTD phosphatase Fcp1 [Taphrina deformans PYCC 5710]
MNQERRAVITGYPGLRYPLTVISIDHEPGKEVHRFQPVFTFKFIGTAVESQDDGEDKEVPRIFVETFDSPVEGTDCSWHIKEGDVIADATTELFSVIEPCSHEVQYAGMCANCGKDLTQGDYLGNADVFRATVAMSHDTLGLTVSHGEAARLERETTKRLVQTSKLSLIVDLDQCVIQTTVDPTVGEWLKDPTNPNHAVLHDVQQFRIAEEGPNAPVYYVKPRPGLAQFFNTICKRYEMHIYTMGTKPYARKVASVIDPDGSIFGSRILSRDENGSNTQKSVQRLFPVETNMVVIMDDRGDVWQWSPNLIKVNPFEFFVGIGDINSSFLPKLSDKPLPPAIPEPKISEAPATTDAETASTLVSNVVVDDAETMAAQADAQTATLEAQVEERPLAKQQEALTATGETADSREGLLQADDNELYHLERTLKRLHENFYKSYNAKIGEVTKDRNLAKLKDSKPRRRSRGAAADVKVILPEMKRIVLQDVVILFSGLIRSDRDPRREWQGQLAVQFGARVLDSKSKELPTHIIVGPDITPTNLTEKAKMHKRYPWIKVVYLKWLTESTSRFERLNEQAYQVDKNAPHVPRPIDHKKTTTEDGQSDTESILTDNGFTDRLIDETSKTMDWHDMEGEIQDFLGDVSDDATTEASDDSDSSVGSQSSTRRRPTRAAHKRLRSQDSSDVESGDGGADLLRSPLSKRRNMARQRRSGLAHSVRAGSSSPASERDSVDGAGQARAGTGRESPSPADSVPERRKSVGSLDTRAAADDDAKGDPEPSESGSDMDDFANELELQLEQ